MDTSAANTSYSPEYKRLYAAALVESQALGFKRTPLVSETAVVGDDMLRYVAAELNEFSNFLNMLVPGYWGNSCQTLSAHIFAFLNASGIPADIVLGNVMIHGNDEFETTLGGLRADYLSTVAQRGSQALHAWVSLGDDVIIDAALPPRLAKHYGKPPPYNDMIFTGRASMFAARDLVMYQPLLVGSEYLAKTNPPDPISYIKAFHGG